MPTENLSIVLNQKKNSLHQLYKSVRSGWLLSNFCIDDLKKATIPLWKGLTRRPHFCGHLDVSLPLQNWNNTTKPSAYFLEEKIKKF